MADDFEREDIAPEQNAGNDPQPVPEEKREQENKPDAAEIQKVIQAGKNVPAEYTVDKEFKEKIKDLFNGYELAPNEELLLKFSEKYVKNGGEMVRQTRNWLTEAWNLKKEGKDYSELQKKIASGIKYIKAECIENIEQHAAQNDKFIADMCSGGRDGFLENWTAAQNILHVCRAVINGPDKERVKPEFRAYFDSILKNEDVLNKKMADLYPIEELPVDEGKDKVDQQPVPGEEKEGFIESTYYVNKLYTRLLSINANLAPNYEFEELIDLLSQSGIEFDKDKVSDSLWNIQHLSRGIMKGFVTQHDEALKEYYKDVTGKELDNDEPLSEDVIKAYSELSKDEGNLTQHAEAIRYFGDTSADYFEVPSELIEKAETPEEVGKLMLTIPLNCVSNALEKMDVSSSNYVRLNRWAEMLTVNQLYHSAASVIRKATDDAFKIRNNGAEAGAEKAGQLDEAVSKYDSAVRARLRFLSRRLETKGRGGKYSQEFNRFSEELKFASEHGDLEMLGILAEKFLNSNSSQLHPDLERVVVAQEVKILVPYVRFAMQNVENALQDCNNIKYGKPVVSHKPTEESVKEDILKSAREKNKLKAELKIDSEFRRVINGFSGKYKLKDHEEILFKYYEKNIQNEDKLTDQVRKWSAEAFKLMINLKDTSELQEKIEDAIRQIKAASIEHIQQHAEQNEKLFTDIRCGGRRGFLEHLAEAENILSVYRAVVNGPDKDLIDPEFTEHFDFIMKNGKALGEMERVFYPDYDHIWDLEERRIYREELKAKKAAAEAKMAEEKKAEEKKSEEKKAEENKAEEKKAEEKKAEEKKAAEKKAEEKKAEDNKAEGNKPEANKQPVPAEVKPAENKQPAAAANEPAPEAPNYYERDKDALEAFKNELKKAMTGTNSGEYKAIINTISSLNKKENGPWGDKMPPAENHAAKLASIKQCIDDYIIHKGKDGVKRNVYKKLAAVEKLNEFVCKKLMELKNLGINSIPDKKINAIYVKKISEIPRESYNLQKVNEQLLKKNVDSARLYGIDCSVEDGIAVNKCMDRIMKRAPRDKHAKLYSMQREWRDCPGKELAPVYELAFNAVLNGRLKNSLSGKDRNDYNQLLTAQGYDSELTDAEAAALRYAEIHKLSIDMQAGADGNEETKEVPWDEAKRQIAQAASEVRKKAASSRAGEGELASLQDKLIMNIDAVKESAILHFIGKSDESLNFLNSIENDKVLVEKWPEISRDIAPFEDIIAKESASYGEGKVRAVLNKYDEMKKKMYDLAVPHAEKIQNGMGKLYNTEAEEKQKSKTPSL